MYASWVEQQVNFSHLHYRKAFWVNETVMCY